MRFVGQWQMIDLDKETTWISALVQFCVILGTAIAALLGVKVVKKYREDSNAEPTSLRDRTIADLVLEAKLRDKFDDDLSKAKTAIFLEMRNLENRLREVETQCKVLQAEGKRPWPPPTRRRQDE